MRCARCGNENPAGNRFCGMCGNTLLSPPVPASTPVAETQTQRAASAGPSIPEGPAPHREPARPVAPPPPPPSRSEEAPLISGPSFLGLSDPNPRSRATLTIDPRSSHDPGNLDYLLDDEDHHRGGAGKYVLILIALALAVGFGYLRWRNQGFPWLNIGPSKPTAAAQNSPPSDTSSSATPANPSITPEPQPPAATQPAIQPVPASAQPTETPAPAQTNAPESTKTPASTTASNPAGTLPTAPDTAKSDAIPPAAKPDTTAANSDSSDADKPAPAAAKPAKADKPKPAIEHHPAKPAAAVAPSKPTDVVAEAQKYLYGKGVSQDCDRGLRLLKPQANAANTRAMVEMGALYSAGLCTPRDLPTSYRWFALALRKEPDNVSIQTDLQKLWGEMTQPERQLAIRLTQ